VYYSGHGIEAGGVNYLVPTDADLSTPVAAGESLVPIDALLDQLARSTPVTIMLLDACRTSAFPAGTSIQPPGASDPLPVAPAGLIAVRGPTPVGRPDSDPQGLGMVIGFAAEPGQPALDGEPGGNSPYAAALLKHIAAGGYSFADLMTLVTEEVYLKTRAKQLPWTNSSLRRVLSFGKPVEETQGDEAAIRNGRRQLLLTIASAPDSTRSYVETVATAEAVPLDALYGMLKALGVDTSTTTDLEQQLLEGVEQLKTFAEARPGAVKSDVELARLGELADRAESEGAIDVALGFRKQASDRAEVLSAQRNEAEAQIQTDRIEIAATFGEHAETASLNFDYATAAEKFARAYDEVSGRDPTLSLYYKWQQAAALAELGKYAGDSATLLSALEAYGIALDFVPREADPVHWADLTNDAAVVLQTLATYDPGTQYLTAAADALTEVLEVRTREALPEGWAATQNNLGMILAAMGERDSGLDYLLQAVDAYNSALEIFSKDGAPYKWGATQNNLGAALQTLGNREQSVERLETARDAYLASLEVRTRDWNAYQWSLTARNLGNVYVLLGTMREGTADYGAAIGIYREALIEQNPAASPYEWGNSQNSFGLALMKLGQRTDDEARLREGIAELERVFTVWSRETYPLAWSATMNNIGVGYRSIAEVVGTGTDDLDRSIAAFRSSLEERTLKIAPLDWAFTTDELGWSLLLLGERKADRSTLEEARATIEAADKAYRQMGYELDDYFAPRYAAIDEALEALG
ncbi:MAG: caspase family protein, partial [Devosia sp.]